LTPSFKDTHRSVKPKDLLRGRRIFTRASLNKHNCSFQSNAIYLSFNQLVVWNKGLARFAIMKILAERNGIEKKNDPAMFNVCLII